VLTIAGDGVGIEVRFVVERNGHLLLLSVRLCMFAANGNCETLGARENNNLARDGPTAG
jgi:hypothetical protein